MSEEEEYDEEDETIKPEEKQKIARLFICKASAGEAKPLANDLQSILGKELLSDQLVENYILDRSEKFHDFVAGEEVILCPESKEADGSYKNPDTGEVIQFKLGKEGLVVQEKKEGEADANPFREKLSAGLKKHMKEHYLTELYAKRACAVYADGDAITCVISSKNTNLASYWTGNWEATYKLSKGAKEIDAKLKINVHYYEGGNVQLNVNKEEKIECECNDDDNGVKEIVKKICLFEDEFQNSISEYYAANEQAFKKVRRGLTIQGTKFDWRLALHENVGNMEN